MSSGTTVLIPDSDLTRDDFLGGKLRLWQPARGYRAGIDAVFLAASLQGSGRVLELGAGTGAVMCCLLRRLPDAQVTGVERNPDYADLARRNLQDNGLQGQIITGDFTSKLFGENAGFDHVLVNPPYFQAGSPAADDGRHAALHEDTPLSVWIDTARKLLRPRGQLTLIHRADRLGGLLAAFGPQFGGIEIMPLAPRAGQPASLVLIRATRDSKAGTSLLAPVVLHEGSHHTGDRNDYTPQAEAIMRHAQALPWN